MDMQRRNPRGKGPMRLPWIWGVVGCRNRLALTVVVHIGNHMWKPAVAPKLRSAPPLVDECVTLAFYLGTG